MLRFTCEEKKNLKKHQTRIKPGLYIGVFSFSKVAGQRPVTLLKETPTQMFSCKFLERLFCRTSPNVEVTYVKLFIIWNFW